MTTLLILIDIAMIAFGCGVIIQYALTDKSLIDPRLATLIAISGLGLLIVAGLATIG